MNSDPPTQMGQLFDSRLALLKGGRSLKRSLTQSWKLSPSTSTLAESCLILLQKTQRQKGQNPVILESIWHWREEARNQEVLSLLSNVACLVISPRQASYGPGQVLGLLQASCHISHPLSFLWVVRDPTILRELIF